MKNTTKSPLLIEKSQQVRMGYVLISEEKTAALQATSLQQDSMYNKEQEKPVPKIRTIRSPRF